MNAALRQWNLRVWGPYLRATARWPSLRSIVPFLPLVALWWAIAAAEVFPRAFFPGPGEVARAFVALVYKGILPEYLTDSVVRLAVGATAPAELAAIRAVVPQLPFLVPAAALQARRGAS